MPHKMNARSSERVNGLQVVLGGYVQMVGALAGDQWFEGDVSCSVVRRVALPDGFFALDGMLETTLHILNDMVVYEAVIARDLDRYLPFLATTTLLMEAIQRGAGREQAHTALREHALAAAIDMREQGRSASDLARRLGADPRFPLCEAEIASTIARSRGLTGAATQQVELFVGRVEELAARYPAARAIEKGRLL